MGTYCAKLKPKKNQGQPSKDHSKQSQKNQKCLKYRENLKKTHKFIPKLAFSSYKSEYIEIEPEEPSTPKWGGK